MPDVSPWPSSRTRPRSAATSSPTIRRSRSGRPEAVAREAHAGAAAARRWPACRSGCTCTSRSAGSAATSATSASTPTRTRRRSSDYLDVLAREWELYARAAGDRRPAAQLRLLRRRHAVVPVDQAARGPGRRASTPVSSVGRRRGDHVRVRAGHAHRGQAGGRSATSASPASASASRTSTTRSSSSTAGRIARRRSSGPTRSRGRSAFRRSTST